MPNGIVTMRRWINLRSTLELAQVLKLSTCRALTVQSLLPQAPTCLLMSQMRIFYHQICQTSIHQTTILTDSSTLGHPAHPVIPTILLAKIGSISRRESKVLLFSRHLRNVIRISSRTLGVMKNFTRKRRPCSTSEKQTVI